MNKDQRDHLLYKLIAIERDYKRGKCDQAFTNLLRVNMTLITELYETQVTHAAKDTAPVKTTKNTCAQQAESLVSLIRRWPIEDKSVVFHGLVNLAETIAETSSTSDGKDQFTKHIIRAEVLFKLDRQLDAFMDLCDAVADEINRQLPSHNSNGDKG